MVIIKIIVGNPFLHLLRFHHLDKISYYDNNKTISDGGITVDFSIIKVHTSN